MLLRENPLSSLSEDAHSTHTHTYTQGVRYKTVRVPSADNVPRLLLPDGRVICARELEFLHLADEIFPRSTPLWPAASARDIEEMVRSFAEAVGKHLVCYDDGDQLHELLDECRRRDPRDRTYVERV